jgi:hypothetical protein
MIMKQHAQHHHEAHEADHPPFAFQKIRTKVFNSSDLKKNPKFYSNNIKVLYIFSLSVGEMEIILFFTILLLMDHKRFVLNRFYVDS